MKFIKNIFAIAALITAFVLSSNSYAKAKKQVWAGTYVQKGGGGGMTIENEGKKLWIEIWRTFKADEERRPDQEKYEAVYFASIHGNTAKRLPFRGDVCPQTFTLMPDSIKLTDECKLGPPVIYYFERVK